MTEPPGPPAALRAAYRSGELILFVGAGVSQLLGLPPWDRMIDHLGERLGFAPQELRAMAGRRTLVEYFRLREGGLGALRDWLGTVLHESSLQLAESAVHRQIATGRFRLIYTTNYDHWLERAFTLHGRRFAKVVDVGDLAGLRQGLPQIVKFHGDVDRAESLVLDETSYFERLDFESPLDIKLRADALGRSVLFIGYSLTDVNLRYLFHRLARLWRVAAAGVPQPRSYVLALEPNPVQQAVLRQWAIETVCAEGAEPAHALERFLDALMERHPAPARA